MTLYIRCKFNWYQQQLSPFRTLGYYSQTNIIPLNKLQGRNKNMLKNTDTGTLQKLTHD